MKSWTVYVPPGEGGKLEELVHLDKEENLMYLETLHICHVALGEGTRKGEKVVVNMRTPEGTFTFGTL